MNVAAPPVASRAVVPAPLVALLGALTAIAPLSIDMYVPAFPAIAHDLHSDSARVPATLASFFAGFAVGQLAAGPVIDRFGRRLPLLLGLALYTVGSFGCALAPSLGVLVIARGVQALGGAFAVVVPRALVRDRASGAAAAQLFSRLMLVMGIAPILAPLVGGALLALGWRSIFHLQALLGGALLVASTAGIRDENAGHGRFRFPLGALLRDRSFLANALAGAFGNAAMFAYISGSPFVLIDLYGVPANRYGLFFGANATALIVASQINARLLRNRTPRAVTALSGRIVLVAGASVPLAVFANWGLAPIAVALFFFVGSLGFLTPNTSALALEKHAAHAGVASAVLGFLSFAIAAFSASIVTTFNDGTARPMAFTMAAFACLAMGAVAVDGAKV